MEDEGAGKGIDMSVGQTMVWGDTTNTSLLSNHPWVWQALVRLHC